MNNILLIILLAPLALFGIIKVPCQGSLPGKEKMTHKAEALFELPPDGAGSNSNLQINYVSFRRNAPEAAAYPAKYGKDKQRYGHRLKVETAHYTIYSTATQPQTALIGEAAESLYAAYTEFFADISKIKGRQVRLKLMLYGNKREFKKQNRGSSWAEAFYQAPYCHAYFPENEHNPYHWMLHEGTHQLNNELARLKIQKWIDEGLATYFGTSKIIDGKLLPGQIDVNTYPIWKLSRISLTGTLESDLKNKNIIPLRTLITGKGGPDINKQFNLYYIHYWSLTHFLFHYNGGEYSAGFRKLIAEGGSADNFEKILGPIDRIQGEWYEYLQQQILELRAIKKQGVIGERYIREI